MKLINIFIGVGMATVATCASLFTNMDQENDGHLILPRGLEKRDAYTCYGSNAVATDCQGALDQLLDLGDKELSLYSGVCVNWFQDSCNVRFCAQPWVAKTMNRTASWIYSYSNDTLMNCVREGQFAVMGDSNNLNGNGGTYRLHLEAKTPR